MVLDMEEEEQVLGLRPVLAPGYYELFLLLHYDVRYIYYRCSRCSTKSTA